MNVKKNEFRSLVTIIALIAVILSSISFVPNSISLLTQTPLVVYDVKNFGALGNGITDDRVAIQKAINTVPATGGTVYFPSGTYRIGSGVLSPVWNLWIALTVPSSVNLSGEGIGKSILKADSTLGLNRFVLNE